MFVPKSHKAPVMREAVPTASLAHGAVAHPSSRTGTDSVLNRGRVGVTEHRPRVGVSKRGGTSGHWPAAGQCLLGTGRFIGNRMFLAVTFVLCETQAVGSCAV